MENRPINVGFVNVVMSARILAVLQPSTAPARRLRDEARARGALLDVTHGRRTRSLILTDTGQVFLSAVLVETLIQRLETVRAGERATPER